MHHQVADLMPPPLIEPYEMSIVLPLSFIKEVFLGVMQESARFMGSSDTRRNHLRRLETQAISKEVRKLLVVAMKSYVFCLARHRWI